VKRTVRLLSTAVGITMLFGATFVSAPSASAVTTTAKKSFIAGLVVAAQSAQRQYGVPASVSLAQAAMNSDWGTSKLATDAKNLFSTRCTAALSATQFAKLAEAQVGKAYVLGAEASIDNNNPKAFDCSELVQWLFGRSGNPITDLAAAQYDATSKVSGSPKAGDLVFLRNNPARANGIGHVAVVTKKLSSGDWEIIEARGHKYGVVKTTLSYWKARSYYAGLRRYSKLNFVGEAGVTSSSAASSYQAGCLSVTSSGKTVKYAKFGSTGDSVLGHAAIVAAGAEYVAARKAMNNVSDFTDAIAKAEQPSDASSYAKALLSIISEFDLTQYDVAPLSIVLLSGGTGTKVTALQYLLSAAGNKVSATGKFDSATVSAVKAVQAAKKLEVDGQAGPNTITALMATVKAGDTNDRVRALKALLGLAGFATDSGTTFGSVTTASLKSFQASAGLSATGAADAKTWSRLFMLLDVATTPAITGKTIVGQSVSANPGTWGPGKVDMSYQWIRGTTAIPGATAATYVLQPEDAGQVIRVNATGSKATYTSLTRTSAGTASVTPATLTATPTPKIGGSRTAGSVLTAIPGTWAPAQVTLTYQWYRNKTAIRGATAASYQLQAADYKAKIKVAVTGSRLGYYKATKTSALTNAVKKGKHTSVPTPRVGGTLAVGKDVVAVIGAWVPAPSGFTYQWYRDNTAIKGATKATYRVQTADRGHTLKVKVSNTGAAFAKTSKFSGNTAKVGQLAWSAIPEVTLSGTAKVGKTLTAKPGTWAPAPKFTYRWYRNSVAIKGATKASYKLTAADKGKTVKVVVTGTKSGYPTAAKQVGVKVS
jgi:peptidoglycan hydrolase-like protein with peptidoglycan-binding domain